MRRWTWLLVQCMSLAGQAWANTGAAPWAQPAQEFQDSVLATYAPVILALILIGLFVANRMYGDQEGALHKLANWGLVAAVVINAPAVVAFWGGSAVPGGASAATLTDMTPLPPVELPAWLLDLPLP